MSVLTEGLKDAFPIIEKFAPTVASVIGGVPGIAAYSALSLLGTAFNANTSDLRGLVTSIMSHPQIEDKLKELEANHGTLLQNLSEELNRMLLTKADIHIQLEWAMRPTQS